MALYIQTTLRDSGEQTVRRPFVLAEFADKDGAVGSDPVLCNFCRVILCKFDTCTVSRYNSLSCHNVP